MTIFSDVLIQDSKIRENHLDLYVMLFHIVPILHRHYINYSITYGTLLSQVRHKNLLIWENDVDLILESDHIFESPDIWKELYDKGIAILITPYEQGYSALYRLVLHKDLNQTPLMHPIMAGLNYNYPKQMLDLHTAHHFNKCHPGMNVNMYDIEPCKLGPFNTFRFKNYTSILNCLYTSSCIHEVIVNHDNEFIPNASIPYNLTKTDIDDMNKFYNSSVYNITLEDISEHSDKCSVLDRINSD